MPLTSLSLLTPFLTGGGFTGGKQALIDAVIHLGGTAVAADRINVSLDTEQIEVTSWAHAQSGYRAYAMGLNSATFEFDMFIGDNPSLDASIRSAYDTNSVVFMEVSPHTGDVQAGRLVASDNNPVWAANCHVLSHMRGGALGAGAVSQVVLRSVDNPLA